jgi:branched-chain amino acid transport system permease protein
MSLVVEQLLNGFQLGVMLFMLAAGLTLIFGIMGVINLAHGSLYMVGAYAAAYTASATGSFWLSAPAGLAAAALAGILMEFLVIRRLYDRDHLDQVLATFGLILFFNRRQLSCLDASRSLSASRPPCPAQSPSRPACPTPYIACSSSRSVC